GLGLYPATALCADSLGAGSYCDRHRSIRGIRRMFNPFQKLEIIEAETFTSLPAEFRKRRRTQWSDHNRHGQEVECFLEGPSFDRNGNLLVVDIPFGRVFRITPAGAWTQVVEYDDWPNGLKLHKDGRAFIADSNRPLL